VIRPGNVAYEKHLELSLSQWRETPSKNDRGVASAIIARFEWGSAFACGLLCYSTLPWNDHEALLVPRSPSRKGRFATMDIVETASNIGAIHCVLLASRVGFPGTALPITKTATVRT